MNTYICDTCEDSGVVKTKKGAKYLFKNCPKKCDALKKLGKGNDKYRLVPSANYLFLKWFKKFDKENCRGSDPKVISREQICRQTWNACIDNLIVEIDEDESYEDIINQMKRLKVSNDIV